MIWLGDNLMRFLGVGLVARVARRQEFCCVFLIPLRLWCKLSSQEFTELSRLSAWSDPQLFSNFLDQAVPAASFFFLSFPLNPQK